MVRKDMQLLIAKAIPRVGMVTNLAQIRRIFGGGQANPMCFTYCDVIRIIT